jgi:ATP-dependent Clp protease ATP-binding subunit ClpB
MNVERMTQRVQEALNAAYTRALSEHNTQTTPEHLLAAILDQPDGVAGPILEKAGLDPQTVEQQADRAIAALPRLQGAQRRPEPGDGVAGLVPPARRRRRRGEVAQRRLRLGRAPAAGDDRRQRRRRQALPRRGLTREKLLAALREVRGNQRVTTQNPEGTYQSLERYGRDLTKAAEARASSIRSSAATKRSAASSKCSRAAPRTTRS